MSYEEIVMEKYMDYCVARTHLVLRVSDHDFRKNDRRSKKTGKGMESTGT